MKFVIIVIGLETVFFFHFLSVLLVTYKQKSTKVVHVY